MAFSKIVVDPQIQADFPDAKIGWLLADLTVTESHPYAEELKNTLPGNLSRREITEDNLISQPDIANWRGTFRKMGMKPNKYKSAVEALTKRVLKGQNVWNISSVVDVYNCVSVMTFLPIGAFDTAHIDGDIVLRYGKAGEKFHPLGDDEEVIEVEPKHVVYVDDSKVCCWLWCYRDTRLTGVTIDTKEAVFIVDSAFTPQTASIRDGLDLLSEHLIKIGCTPKSSGIVGE